VHSSFRVEVADGSRFLDPFSPTHTLEVERRGERLAISVVEEIRGRLALFLPLAGDAVNLTVATHRPPGEPGYFMLTLTPERDTASVEPRDVTVVLDVSGSMSGERLEQAKAAVRHVLGSLSRVDRFRLVAFSSDVRVHSVDWRFATVDTLWHARAWVHALVADGGTNIGGALQEAFRLESPRGRLPIVLFLTDGLPSAGEQSPERLADMAEARSGRARIFAFAMGHDANTQLLDRLGQAGRGDTDCVQPGEDVGRAEDEVLAEVAAHDPCATKVLGGRLFRLRGGVWTGAAHGGARRAVEVRAFSSAYFAVLRARPELAAVLAELDRVVVAGAEVSLGFGERGLEQISTFQLREFVRGFRGGAGS
jgi:Ca-activated chloride channel family protein